MRLGHNYLKMKGFKAKLMSIFFLLDVTLNLKFDQIFPFHIYVTDALDLNRTTSAPKSVLREFYPFLTLGLI